MKELKFLSLVMVAGAAALLTACTSESENGPSNNISYESIKAAEQVPVTFGTYMGEKANTRTVATGITVGDIATNTNLQNSSGFGVFAYYTHGTTDYLYPNTEDSSSPGNKDAYAPTSPMAPNFMYNQRVTYSASAWSYTPVKYWPNDFNGNNQAVDDQSTAATGTEHGRVSFFAYAPYVSSTAASLATSGITGFSDNDASGNPTVTYVIGNDGQNVDLLWGVKGSTTQSAVGSINTGGKVLDYSGSIFSGSPKTLNINLAKQKTTSSNVVDFSFYHTLAQVGGKVNSGLQVVADVDGDNNIGGDTRITVNEITIKPTTGVYMKFDGTFDLATGTWSSSTTPDASNHLDFTHTIGAIANDVPGSNTWKLNGVISEKGDDGAFSWPGKYSASNWASGTPAGVTATAADVYDDDANPKPIVFIPGTIPNLTIYIDYYVRTGDGNLDGGFSQVRQQITKNIVFTSAVDAHKQYKLLLHLGMTSVKVTATVAAWDNGTDSTGNDVYLPINVN